MASTSRSHTISTKEWTCRSGLRKKFLEPHFVKHRSLLQPNRDMRLSQMRRSLTLHNYLDSLRLLEAARHHDSRPPELSWRPQGYGSLLDSYGQPATRSLQPIFDSSSAGSPRDINIPNVRWPPTQYTPASLLEETRARLLNEPSSTPSGPTSSREETLRRAYHLLQDQTANQQHTRNTMPAYARLASGVDWMSRDQRSATPQDSDSFSGLRHTSELLPTLGSSPHQNVGGSPSSTSYRHARQQSNDLVIDLPPLTPLSDPEGKDYDFRQSTSPEPRAIPSSPLTSSSDPTSGQPFHALKNHRFGRYQPSCLHNGAVFVGTQCSDRQEYKVKVEIKHVDMDESFVCGHLIIEGMSHKCIACGRQNTDPTHRTHTRASGTRDVL